MKSIVNFGWKRIVRYFMAGLLAVLPLVLTFAIVSWFFNFLRGIVGPDTPIGKRLASIGLQLYQETGRNGANQDNPETFLAYLLGVALVFGAIFCLGLLVELGAKRFLRSLTDGFVSRIPLIGGLYGSMKQLVDLFDQPAESEIKAMSVVFCHFAEGGGTGVLALMPSPEVIEIEGVGYNVVMIPTAPVPFGGGLIFVPAAQVKTIDMSVDNFISIYVSMGVSTPEFMSKKDQKVADSRSTAGKSDK